MSPAAQVFNTTDFRRQLKEELTGNILPFWMTYTLDKINGGFFWCPDQRPGNPQ
jgi:mannose/cellobiose epimerase-like protein (N-acyl-D-glucosamine 2-epimerase family)